MYQILYNSKRYNLFISGIQNQENIIGQPDYTSLFKTGQNYYFNQPDTMIH